MTSCLAITACDATGKFGAEGSAVWNIRNMSSAKKLTYFTDKCQQYGYETGTDAMRDCVADERRNVALIPKK